MDMGKVVLVLVAVQIAAAIVRKFKQKNAGTETVEDVDSPRTPAADAKVTRSKAFIPGTDSEVHHEHSATPRTAPDWEAGEHARTARERPRKTETEGVRKSPDAQLKSQGGQRAEAKPMAPQSKASRVGKDLLEQLAKELGLPPSTLPIPSGRNQKETSPQAEIPTKGNANRSYRDDDGNMRVSKPTARPSVKTREGSEDWEARRETRKLMAEPAARPPEAASPPMALHTGLQLRDKGLAFQAIELQAIFGEAPGMRHWKALRQREAELAKASEATPSHPPAPGASPNPKPM